MSAAEIIWKFPLPCNDTVEVAMPFGARILRVAAQNDAPFLWAIVQPAVGENTTRRFVVRGTGHPFNGSEGEYIGTFELNEGRLVFHVFDEVQP